MAKFDKGVLWFTSGIAKVPIHFPEAEIKCQYCPFCRSESELQRYWCRLTNDMIYNPSAGILESCPIEFVITKEKEV